MIEYKENNKNGNELITKKILLKAKRNELAIGIEPEIIKKDIRTDHIY